MKWEHGILLEQRLQIIIFHVSNFLDDDLVSGVIDINEFLLLVKLVFFILIIIVPVFADILCAEDGLGSCRWHLTASTFPLSLHKDGSVDLISVETLEDILLLCSELFLVEIIAILLLLLDHHLLVAELIFFYYF